MKYFKIFLILIYFMFIPAFVFAEDLCQDSNVIITDISLKKSTGNTEELEEATIQNNEVHMNVKMYEVGDAIEYNVSLKNQGSEVYVLENNIQSNNDYINYTIEPKSEHDYKIESSEEKDFVLKAVYTREVDDEEFLSGKYNAGGNPIIIVRDNSLINPQTGTILIIIIFLLTFIVVTVIPLKNNSLKIFISVGILLGFSIIPFYTKATCSENIGLNCNITIGYVIPNPCTYDGNLVQGASYTNGQYTYKYKQEYYNYNASNTWNNMDVDGWSVKLTDLNSTSPVTSKLCTSINDKPIVSMSYTFGSSQATSIDLSSFDTSAVKNMKGMFYRTMVPNLDLSNFDTVNVDNYESMFSTSSSLVELDISGFDFSDTVISNYYGLVSYLGLEYSNSILRVLKINNAKIGTKTNNVFSYLYSVEKIEANNLDLSLGDTLYYMFCYDKKLVDLEMDNWYAPNVTSMKEMFNHCEKIKKVDFSSITAGKVKNFNMMFANCYELEEINLSNLVHTDLESVAQLLVGVQSTVKKLIIDNWSPPSSNSLYQLFQGPENRILYVSAKNWVIPETFTYFADYSKLSYVDTMDVTEWDLSNTTNMQSAFYDAYSFKNFIGLDTWDTSNVTNMKNMFKYLPSVTELDLSSFETSQVTDMSYMFSECYKLTVLDLSCFDLNDSVNLENMFSNCSQLQTVYGKNETFVNRFRNSSYGTSNVNFAIKT